MSDQDKVYVAKSLEGLEGTEITVPFTLDKSTEKLEIRFVTDTDTQLDFESYYIESRQR